MGVIKNPTPPLPAAAATVTFLWRLLTIKSKVKTVVTVGFYVLLFCLEKHPGFYLEEKNGSYILNPHSMLLKACFSSGNTAKGLLLDNIGKTAKMYFS